MISIELQKVKQVQFGLSHEIQEQYNSALKKLEKINATSTDDCLYLYQTIELFKNNSNILSCEPHEIDHFVRLMPSVPKIEKDTSKGKIVVNSEICKEILTALNYKGLRGNFYPKYFKEIGIKACVYCNANLAVSVDRIDNDGNDDVRAKFQVDHYFPKTEYPFLSICLFNLYPSCASCNNAKLDKKVKFKLYSNIPDDIDNSKFTFKLKSYDEAKYLLNGRVNPPDFEFIEDLNLDEGYSSFNSTFDIKGIYDTQIDLIEDLIDKSLIYDQNFQESLIKNFPKLFLSKEHFERFILGNYPRVQDIHKRPMSKFMQDIAQDLDLI